MVPCSEQLNPVQSSTNAKSPNHSFNRALALPALNPDFLYAALDATAYAAFVKESRSAGATKLHRKSGEARDQSPDSFTER
jgi:hypothetical protein